jgi:hypothetical protein
MDRQDYIMQAVLFVMMLVMVASTYLPNPWNMVAVFGTYAALFGYMFFSTLVLQYTLAKYPALDAVIVGYNPDGTGVVRQTLLIQDYETTGTADGTNMTRIRLSHVFKDPEGGRTRYIHIYHFGGLNQRLKFKPGRIRWSGTTVDHPQVEHVMLVRDPVGLPFRAKLYPVFHLIASGADAEWWMKKQMEAMLVAKRGR